MQMNRNSHTTSTKCQYQAANSKTEMLGGREVPGIGAEQADQQETTVPHQHMEAVGKPVAMKKVAPYMLPE